MTQLNLNPVGVVVGVTRSFHRDRLAHTAARRGGALLARVTARADFFERDHCEWIK